MLTTPSPLINKSFIPSTHSERVATILSHMLGMPWLEENAPPIRKLVMAAFPVIRMTLGNDAANMLKVVTKPHPSAIELHHVLNLSQLSTDDIVQIAQWLREQADYLEHG